MLLDGKIKWHPSVHLALIFILPCLTVGYIVLVDGESYICISLL